MRYAVAVSNGVRSIKFHSLSVRYPALRCLHSSARRHSPQHPSSPDALDPRLEDLGNVIRDEYAIIRENYNAPKHAVVLAHGLLGFAELRLAGRYLPGVQYWRGIKEALSMQGVRVITATVPPSASIEMRAEELARDIAAGAPGEHVNIIAHSMSLLTLPLGVRTRKVYPSIADINQCSSGLDSRYMITHLKPTDFKVKSLTTIATPHRGSAVADFALKQIGDDRLAQLYYALDRLKVETGAFAQLTRDYMTNTFNPATPDIEDVRYFSYGAAMQPSFWSVFRLSHRLLEQIEGYNDGLVSVASSKWGAYKGTLEGVSHLDLINWSNRLKWLAGEITGNRQRFNAIAFYLDIADMLAKEGL
ncbi:triacylglycerol lipase [Aspergillus costaricaensis CBS 115574]|uniref:Triacylglycerol lipase n=1 Tax=Aspergillus costaricaensis CBS 115574 TaxID=1448317 RepID=A0ACD1IK71_9EURO|nr:triacylglycerol lipase [Aspergillus costaricaensis CBS 115574]RAK90986.1 triacylglycerol lipase [Aspergillus costaricaensis CBS 115574]